MPVPNPDQFFSLRELERITGRSHSFVWRLARIGAFGPRVTTPRSSIARYQRQHIEAELGPFDPVKVAAALAFPHSPKYPHRHKLARLIAHRDREWWAHIRAWLNRHPDCRPHGESFDGGSDINALLTAPPHVRAKPGPKVITP